MSADLVSSSVNGEPVMVRNQRSDSDDDSEIFEYHKLESFGNDGTKREIEFMVLTKKKRVDSNIVDEQVSATAERSELNPGRISSATDVEAAEVLATYHGRR